MKHKHADLIHAWADGAQIERLSAIGDWLPDSDTPEWLDDYQYRIKPKPIRAFREVLIGNELILRFYPSDTGWMCGISNEMMDAIEEVCK